MENIALHAPLPALRNGRPATTWLVERRGPAALVDDEIAGLPCVIAGRSDAPVRILHLHGGGYRMGSAAGWRGFAERLAAATGARVVVPDYALAPEKPFPAALHDGFAVLQALSEAPGRLILSGDSAGGGLALSLAAAIGPSDALAGLALISPWLDLTLQGESFVSCGATDQLFSHASAADAAETYLQGVSPEDPLASPLFADLSNLPPVLLMASTSEVLRDDSLALACKLARGGRRADVSFEPGVAHVWPVLYPNEAASHRALARYAAFVSEINSGGV